MAISSNSVIMTGIIVLPAITAGQRTALVNWLSNGPNVPQMQIVVVDADIFTAGAHTKGEIIYLMFTGAVDQLTIKRHILQAADTLSTALGSPVNVTLLNDYMPVSAN